MRSCEYTFKKYPSIISFLTVQWNTSHLMKEGQPRGTSWPFNISQDLHRYISKVLAFSTDTQDVTSIKQCWYSWDGKPNCPVNMLGMVWYGGASNALVRYGASRRCPTIQQPILSSHRGAGKCVAATSIYARFSHHLISPRLAPAAGRWPN